MVQPTTTPIMTMPVANVMADGTPDPINTDQVYPALSANSDLLPAENLWQYSPPQTGMFAQTQMSPEPQFTSGQQPQQQSVVQGMFPEVDAMQRALYQQKQNEAMQAQAMRYASLDPMQQAQYSLYLGGQQLGGAIGGALGGVDPQLRLISMRNAISKQIDMRDPESYFKAATLANQAGDREFAASLVDAGTKIESTMSQVELRKAQAQKAKNYQQAQTDSAQKRATVSDLEQKLATDPTYKPTAQEIASVRWIVANESKAKTQIDPVTNQMYVIEGLNIEQAAPNIANYLKQTNIPIATPSSQVGQLAPNIKTVETPASLQKAAEREKELVLKASEEANQVDALTELKTRTGEVRTTISDTKKLISGYTTGYGSVLSLLPLTDARTLENNLESIKADLAFSQLQALKDASKTGASGLGQTTRNEFEALQSRIKKLDPKSANFAKDLDAIDAVYSRLEKQLETKAGRVAEVSAAGKTFTAVPTTPTSKPTSVNQNQDAIIQKFIDFNGGKPTRQQAIDFLKKNGKIQ